MAVRKNKGKTGIIRLLEFVLRLSFQFVLGVSILIITTIVLFRYFDPPTWSWKIQREFSSSATYPEIARHQWVSLDRIAPSVQLAVVAAEDQRFPTHFGIDPEAIIDALEEADRGNRLRGASTLTQQTAKNLFLWSNRDLARKVLEMGIALLLELFWDKQRILEVYLNIVEFGPGVFGVGAASKYWFQALAGQLSKRQAARLAAVLPNPWRYRAHPPSPYVVERSRWIEQQMEQLGYAWLHQ
ncbi:MAG: monofunctional biosynthetic peptidoglycan transglycosylase [Candidatus Thiodiazotropha lotti]|nr:monofunctional biosynthetic peptidoglycan transglycosylase [Candidatus Thiodiazotropha lotti]MCG8004726.1 monofunctional biosynthetic peptidoglycan transglycosylase [Candidatus Thiodiazotropha lotti]MCG8006690.1 monofunctional biosynthetic peptidoglycan transglycosylase [Candidatus Thiodiazotropha lotti]MCW4188353.1 monofunctional biosynthetic peptidoglycan transglycosylase [Candidatus Thiodiazotropha lotti]MCW4194272.1 monofunctional biosynthetic peptidoglycan transglycosylase [Candidatus T